MKEDQSKGSKVDNSNLHRKRSFIDQFNAFKIPRQFVNLLNFNKIIT